MAQRPRGFETFGDMVRSLAVTFALIGFILLVTHRHHGDGISTVAWQPVVTRLPAPLLKPTTLPEGYRVTSARVVSGGKPGLHLGALTKAGRYVAVEEAVTADADYVRAVAGASTPDGSASITGHTWARSQSTDREGHVTRVLTRSEGSVTVVVFGTASWEDLTELITVARL